jgi:uncharacterized membrane protein YfcA
VVQGAFWSFIAGLIGGISGLGGGMVVNPLLLALGTPPQVASATSGLLVFYSGTTAALGALMLERLPVIYAGIYLAVTIVGSYIGVTLVSKAIKKTGRPSLIVLVLGLVMLLAGAVVAGVGIYEAVHNIQTGKYMGAYDYCSLR